MELLSLVSHGSEITTSNFGVHEVTSVFLVGRLILVVVFI